jgi:hypothetical protein
VEGALASFSFEPGDLIARISAYTTNLPFFAAGAMAASIPELKAR